MAAKNCTGKYSFGPGARFGRLEVLSVSEDGSPSRTKWLCRCDCGADTVVRADALASGATQSCGCLQKELAAEKLLKRTLTHGDAASREHAIWRSMKNRCLNPKTPDFQWYGRRGIRVCDTWRNSYEAFVADMGRAPTPKHSIDRIDNDGDYSPENCRWATRREQGNNKRNNRKIEYGGQIYTLSELARKAGLKVTTLIMRLDQYHWPIEQAVEAPLRGKI